MPILLVSMTRSAVKIVASSMTVSARRSGRVAAIARAAEDHAGPVDLGEALERGAERQAVLVMAHPDFRNHGGLRLEQHRQQRDEVDRRRRRSAGPRPRCRRRRRRGGGARRARPPWRTRAG